MKVVDASVAVAAFSGWHPHNAAALAALDPPPSIVAQTAFETYSVLTRFPDPHRVTASLAHEWLEDAFSDRWIGLPARALRMALARLHERGISGGATYDGLIGITAAVSDATLVTLDRRALATYERVGVDVELVA